MKAYSRDLRARIVSAREAGESVVSVAQRFGVCTKTVYEYCAKAKRGALAPRPLPGREPILKGSDVASLVSLMQENPSLTLEQLRVLWQQQSGQQIARSTLHDALRRGFTLQKKRASLWSVTRRNGRSLSRL